MAKNNKFGMPVSASTNQIDAEGEAEEEVEAEDVAFVLDNQTQLINGDAFQLQEDFMQFDEEKDEGDEGGEDLADIQQQLMQHFDNFDEEDDNKNDVQAALNF